MKKRMVRITGCLLAGALSIGSFGLNTYAAPVAGVSSVTAVEIAEGQTPAAGVSQALAQCLADSNDAAAQKAAEQAEEQSYYNAILQSTETPVPTTTAAIGSLDWDADDSYRLAKIAMAEAEGEDTEGKALVILVVLNRVWSDDFPDTIEGVITEDTQFAAYENGRYDRVEPDADCYRALEMVQVEHWDESRGATYFERTTDETTWHNTTLKKLFTHGNHTFYTEE